MTCFLPLADLPYLVRPWINHMSNPLTFVVSAALLVQLEVDLGASLACWCVSSWCAHVQRAAPARRLWPLFCHNFILISAVRFLVQKQPVLYACIPAHATNTRLVAHTSQTPTWRAWWPSWPRALGMFVPAFVLFMPHYDVLLTAFLLSRNCSQLQCEASSLRAVWPNFL